MLARSGILIPPPLGCLAILNVLRYKGGRSVVECGVWLDPGC